MDARRADANPVEVQAVFLRVDVFTYAAARQWVEDNGFSANDYHERLDPETGKQSHHIFRQWQPDQAEPDSWATLSDGWPDGITVSVARRKDIPMQSQLTKGTQSAADPFEFVLSDETADRAGDVIKADGWQLRDFRNNPIALYGHSHHDVIGRWENVRIEGKRLIGRLHMAAAGTSPLVDTVRSLLEQRILKAVSVGFQPLEYEERKSTRGDFLGINFIKQALHEVSVVAVPANPNALLTAKAAGMNRLEMRRMFGEGASGLPTHHNPAAQTPPANAADLQRIKEMHRIVRA